MDNGLNPYVSKRPQSVLGALRAVPDCPSRYSLTVAALCSLEGGSFWEKEGGHRHPRLSESCNRIFARNSVMQPP